MHLKLDKSFSRHNHCKSALDLLEKEKEKQREENKFKQFQEYYFFFEKQKNKKKNSSLERVKKMELNQRNKDERLKQIKGKNVETMKKIQKILDNKSLMQKKLNESLMNKKEDHEYKSKEVFSRRKNIDEEREEYNKDVLAKQIDYINQSQRIDENNRLNYEHLK